MAFVPAKDAEPIPGYRLVDKLGVGGYGEVWKATAPGGLAKAVKIVYGELGGSRAEQELKALSRIKEVRHPFLLSLERIEVVDTQLFIVTELAEGCLYDRFHECRKTGMHGIPRDELLHHLRDAAEALDYMAETHGLQHLDIKPQNLLLVGGRIKVADFGLVKELVGTSVTATGGVTPVYATPEAFDGRVSRYSDQYSLAIVYQEMLTGVRPFPGLTLMQLAAQHTNSPPLLTPLPPSDRAAVAKALSKVPDQRFASCLKMVEALLAARQQAGEAPAGRDNAQPRPDKPGRSRGGMQPILQPTDSQDNLDLRTQPRALRTHMAGDASTPDPAAVTPPGTPALRPTLFLGIGGLAGAVLVRLKKKLLDRYGGPTLPPIFGLLLVDTDREDLRRTRQAADGQALDPAETLLAPLHLPEYYRPESKKLLRWLDRRWLYGIPRSQLTEGLRPLGRLALVDNGPNVLDQVRESLRRVSSAEAVAEAAGTLGVEVAAQTPRVVVVASLTGGTGGGMLVSMAYLVRQALQELRLIARGVCGMLLYATNPKPADQEMARLNAYATLREVDHFSRPGVPFPGDPDHGLLPFAAGHGPFEESYVVPLGEGLGAAEAAAATDVVAEYLDLDACCHSGTYLEQFRRQTHAGPGEPFTFRSFGLARIGTPGTHLAEQSANVLCRLLAENWLAGPGEAEGQCLEREAQRKLAAQGLDEAGLGSWVQQAAAPVLGENPEANLPKLLADAAKAAGANQPSSMLEAVDAAFAPKAEPRVGSHDAGTTPRETVRTVAEERGAEICRGLADWLIGLVESPGKGFKSAEVAVTILQRGITSLADATRGRLAQVTADRQALRQHIATVKPGGKGSGIRWLGRRREGPANAEGRLLQYCRLWVREIAEANSLSLFGVLQHEIGAVAAELTQARQKLERFAEQFRPVGEKKAPHEAQPPAKNGPSPPGELAAEEGLVAELLFRFDDFIQFAVLKGHGGLWGVFSGGGVGAGSTAHSPRPTPELVAEELLVQARGLIQKSIPDLDTAGRFLRASGGPEKALPTLLAYLEAARPKLRPPGGWEHLVLALPAGQSGKTLGGLVAAALPDVPSTVVATEDEVVFCYEAAGFELEQTTQALLGPADPPLDLVRRVMTRLDVAWTLPEPSPA